MAISQGKSTRLPSGARNVANRGKRKAELGRDPAETRVDEKRSEKSAFSVPRPRSRRKRTVPPARRREILPFPAPGGRESRWRRGYFFAFPRLFCPRASPEAADPRRTGRFFQCCLVPCNHQWYYTTTFAGWKEVFLV